MAKYQRYNILDSRYGLYVFILLLVAIDRITKDMVVYYLNQSQIISLIPNVLEITYVRNSGIAFGLLSGLGPIITILVTLIIIVCLCMLHRVNRLYRIPLSLIIGGAIGNLIDRLLVGTVVDFIRVPFFSVFNLADTFVSIGVIIYIILISRK